jgi:hypothetical protein
MAGTGVSVDVAVVPRLWPGEPAVCIASGPSLTREDVEYCRGKARVIVINRTIQLAPWADVLYGCDARFWKWHAAEAKAFQGLKFSLERDLDNDCGQVMLKNGGIWGLSTDPTTIRNGRNSGYQAINLAVLLGMSRIVLLGYDMQAGANGEAHWHSDHPNNFSPGDPQFRSWRAAFLSMVQPLADLGVSVVNCTKQTALTMFPCQRLEDTL